MIFTMLALSFDVRSLTLGGLLLKKQTVKYRRFSNSVFTGLFFGIIASQRGNVFLLLLFDHGHKIKMTLIFFLAVENMPLTEVARLGASGEVFFGRVRQVFWPGLLWGKEPDFTGIR